MFERKSLPMAFVFSRVGTGYPILPGNNTYRLLYQFLMRPDIFVSMQYARLHINIHNELLVVLSVQ